MEESIKISQGMLEGFGQNADKAVEQLTAGLKMIETLTPSLFVMTSVISVFVIQLVSFPIAKRFGIKIEGFKPFREMSLPKSILWYYLITIIASFLFNPSEGSYWFMALVNIAFILQIFMVIQGLSLIFFFSHLKGWPKAVPVLAAVFTFLMPFLLYIVRILGIIDLGFDLRQRLGKSDEQHYCLGAENMPSYLEKRSIRYPIFGLMGITVVLLGILAYYNWLFALIGLFLAILPFYYLFQLNQKHRKETEEYISTLSYRVKKVGEEALMEMPIGIMLINDDYYIEWTNPFWHPALMKIR